MEGGLESLISLTSVRLFREVTGGILRPIPRRMHRRRVHIGKLRPISVFRHSAPSTFVFKDLATASPVFLRHGALREPFKLRIMPIQGPQQGR